MPSAMRLCSTSPAVQKGQPHPRQARLSRLHARQPESDDRLRDEFMEELSTMKHRFQKPTKAQLSSLEIGWKLSAGQNQAPKACTGCQSEGTTECRFCNGTGVMQLGDTLYCSNTGCSVCPVCNGMGQVECNSCKGSGYLAWWMPDPEPEGSNEEHDR